MTKDRSVPPLSTLSTTTTVVAKPRVHAQPRRIKEPITEAPPATRRFSLSLAWLSACLLMAGSFAVAAWMLGSSEPRQLPELSAVTAPATTPIEQIRVGTNVKAENPLGETDLEFGWAVDPFTWRRIQLLAHKQDGSLAEVELLRPDWWLAEQGAVVGARIPLSVPECGIEGEADILSVAHCPPLASPQPGYRTVTGTFKHLSAEVFDLTISGLSSPIGTTANHPFFSLDREEFVRADELQIGERLQTVAGESTVLSFAKRGVLSDVHNLEVHIDHVYHVAASGVLVHNACTGYVYEITGELLENGKYVKKNYVGSAWQYASRLKSANHPARELMENGINIKIKVYEVDLSDARKLNKLIHGRYGTTARAEARMLRVNEQQKIDKMLAKTGGRLRLGLGEGVAGNLNSIRARRLSSFDIEKQTFGNHMKLIKSFTSLKAIK